MSQQGAAVAMVPTPCITSLHLSSKKVHYHVSVVPLTEAPVSEARTLDERCGCCKLGSLKRPSCAKVDLGSEVLIFG